QDEAEQLIDDINRTPIWQRKPNAKELGERLRVTNPQRERLRLWTIAACDMSHEEAQEWRKAKDRQRKRGLRKSRGSEPRADYEANSISKTKPWIADGFNCRRTWERHRNKLANASVASASAVRLVKAEDKLATPERAEAPRRAMVCRGDSG